MILPKVYFITTDESQYIIPVTDYLMEKYTEKQLDIFYLGYTKPQYKLSERSTFIELNYGYPRKKQKWFLDLYRFFSSIDDEYVIFTTDDNPMVNYVNLEDLKYAIEYLNNNKDIGMLNAYNTVIDNKNILYQNDKYVIGKVSTENCHKTTSQMNIWKKQTLLRVLSSNYNNLYDFELHSERFLQKDDQVIMFNKKDGTNLFHACFTSLCSESRNKDYIFVLPIMKEDLQYFIDNNLIDKNKINYNASYTHVFPYNAFNNEFNYSKMRQYAVDNGWDENNISANWGYSINEWEKMYPHYL